MNEEEIVIVLGATKAPLSGRIERKRTVLTVPAGLSHIEALEHALAQLKGETPNQPES